MYYFSINYGIGEGSIFTVLSHFQNKVEDIHRKRKNHVEKTKYAIWKRSKEYSKEKSTIPPLNEKIFLLTTQYVVL